MINYFKKLENMSDSEIETEFHNFCKDIPELSITVNSKDNHIEVKRQFLMIEELHRLGLTKEMIDFELFNEEYEINS